MSRADLNRKAPLHEQVRAFKTKVVARTLTECGGNRTRAAEALGLQRTYLLRLIRQLGVDVSSPPR